MDHAFTSKDSKPHENIDLPVHEDSVSQCNKQSIAENADEVNKYALEYDIESKPPWHVIAVYSLQQVLANIGGTISTVYIIHATLCTEGREGSELLFAELLSSAVFMMGVASWLQCTLGCRLPIVQGSSATFIAPIVAMMNTDKFRCPYDIAGPDLGNGTTYEPESDEQPWESRLHVIAGSLMAASLIQIVLGCSGVMGFLMNYIGPLTVIPTVSLIGLTLFETATAGAQHQWGIAVLTVVLIVVFSLCMDNIGVPLPTYTRGEGFSLEKYHIFRLYPHIFAIGISWLLSYILTVTDVFPPSSTDVPNYARTDAKVEVIEQAKWFFVPYPGRMGGVEFDTGVFVGFSAAVLASIIESVGDYYATAKICTLPPPPKHAVNRGIAMEGVASFLSGAVGAAHATTSYSGTIGFIGITGVASRLVWIVMSILLIALGLFGKFGAALSIIPDPIIGGLSVVGLGMVISVAMSNIVYVDMQSSRNLMILAVSHMFGLMLPFWISDNPGVINTGDVVFDQVLTVLLSTGMLVGGVIGFTMDNLLPGSKEERGMISFQEVSEAHITKAKEEQRHVMASYDIPFITNCSNQITCCSYVPFMPSFRGFKCSCCHRHKITSLDIEENFTQTQDLKRRNEPTAVSYNDDIHDDHMNENDTKF